MTSLFKDGDGFLRKMSAEEFKELNAMRKKLGLRPVDRAGRMKPWPCKDGRAKTLAEAEEWDKTGRAFGGKPKEN